MEKVIHRKLSFSADEIKQALIMWLKDRDHPYPNGTESPSEFKLLQHGAEMSWQETSEI